MPMLCTVVWCRPPPAGLAQKTLDLVDDDMGLQPCCIDEVSNADKTRGGFAVRDGPENQERVSTGSHVMSRQEFKGSDMPRAHYGKVATVQRCNGTQAEAFGDGDEGGVNHAEAEVVVLLD
jgi:hypothetical protein